MFFTHNAIGMEVSQHGIRFAVLAGGKGAPRLVTHGGASFASGIVRILHREPNVADPKAFVGTVREEFCKLLARTNLVSVTLPDAVGRIMIMDFDTRFKNREEGRDMIRWKLKKSLPLDSGDMHLDYQTLRERDNGSLSVLIAVVARQVVTQYEDLLLEAGIQPNRIDFNTFNLYRVAAKRVPSEDTALFVAFHRGMLSMLVLTDGVIDFYRAKEMGRDGVDPNRIFMEVNSSLLVYRDKNPGREVKSVLCLAPPDGGESFSGIVAEASGVDPVLFAPQTFIASNGSTAAAPASLHDLAAALGAATRNL
ncbi:MULTISPECIES: type IV pilus biogenesis protein PilM [Geobacter]|uniref:Pilus assembly protein PilM n=2 Tax=Geobacter TaxID=28231 RepID=A0A0C1TMP0_9BACT|nr:MULTISPECIES: pilus assembly protein PilM [Geobacter]ANA40258.1 pilus assembly protein PilM [Geobacter anodireducens]KIE42164.1 pilus assembly protein PilM [Geobacter soli]MBE2888645.1 pilus assembly protein PilM [Geobacter anodireducens]HMN01552.1 pilus assembly protein PilM [Geobacter anodireducens]